MQWSLEGQKLFNNFESFCSPRLHPTRKERKPMNQMGSQGNHHRWSCCLSRFPVKEMRKLNVAKDFSQLRVNKRKTVIYNRKDYLHGTPSRSWTSSKAFRKFKKRNHNLVNLTRTFYDKEHLTILNPDWRRPFVFFNTYISTGAHLALSLSIDSLKITNFETIKP